MKRYIYCLGMLLCIVVSPTTYAWSVTTFDKESGLTYTVLNADTPEEAQTLAIQGCKRRAAGADCAAWAAVHGTAILIATGDTKVGTQLSQVTNQNPEAAAAGALAECSRRAQNCHLTLADWDNGSRWAAVAKGDKSGLFTSYDAESRSFAEKKAVDGCEKRTDKPGTCRILPELVTAEHAWFASARSGSYAGLGFSTESQAEAENNALSACRTGSSAPAECKVAEIFENPGPLQAPAALRRLQRQIARSKGSSASAVKE